MTPKGGVAWVTAAVMAGAGVASWLAPPAGAAAASSAVTCWSAAHPAAAAKLSRDIQAARRGRVSAVGAGLYDPGLGLGCWLNANVHFDSASVVKATILGALLRKTEQQRRHLTRTEASLATAMITRSDNNAASALWADVGRTWLRHFLNLAQMTHTALGPGGYWGLTQITAHDEVFLLQLLISPNGVPRQRLPRLRAGPDGQGHPVAAVGCPGRRARQPDRARQGRLAAPVDARVAHPQHRLFHRP